MADALQEHNDARKAAGRVLEATAVEYAHHYGSPPVVVVAVEEATPGIAGITASRLVERWGWPAVVLGPTAGGVWAGSGRSALGWNMGAAVLDGVKAGVLARGGGHAAACGMHVERDGVDDARRWLADRFRADMGGDVVPVRAIEACLTGDDVAPGKLAAIAADFARWDPWGPDWRPPVLAVRDARITRTYEHANGHVFLTLDIGGRAVEAVWWRAPPDWRASAPGGALTAIVGINKDRRPGFEDRPHRLRVEHGWSPPVPAPAP